MIYITKLKMALRVHGGHCPNVTFVNQHEEFFDCIRMNDPAMYEVFAHMDHHINTDLERVNLREMERKSAREAQRRDAAAPVRAAARFAFGDSVDPSDEEKDEDPWELIRCIRWSDSDDGEVTPRMIRMRLDERHFGTVIDFVRAQVDRLEENWSGECEEIERLSPGQRRQFWSHIVARGEDMFNSVMASPAAFGFMVDLYVPFLQKMETL